LLHGPLPARPEYGDNNYIRNNKKFLELLIWCPGGTPTFCRFGTAPETSRNHVSRFQDFFPRSGRRCPEGSDRNWSQLDGGVVAPEAGKDVLHHPPCNFTPFRLQEVLDAGLHVLKPLGGGVQDLECGAKG
jgi:hypothetical protein